MDRNNIPALSAPQLRPYPPVFQQYASVNYPDTEPEQPGIPLSHYLWILRRHAWKIAAFVVASAVCTFIVSSRLTPIYESTATIDVDRRMPTGVIGQEAMASTLNDADQFMATQVRLIQSDSVLRPVARRFRLNEPKDSTSRSVRAADAPIKLKSLKVMRPSSTYLLLVSYRSADPRLAADVTNAISQSYLEHTYNIRIRSNLSLSSFMEKQIEELKAKMERSSAALAGFEKELNVINPEEKTSILSSRLLQLNTEYTNAQSDRVRKEAGYNSVRAGSLEAAQVAQGDGFRMQDRLNQARGKFAEVKQYFGTNHPEYRKASAQLTEIEQQYEQVRTATVRRVEIEYREALNRESMLKQAVAETKAEFDKLNARSFDYQALKREAEADKKLYEDLVRKIKETGLNAGFQSNSIRLVDPARPGFSPVYPNVQMNVLLAFLFSALVGTGVAILSDTLDNTIRDPELVRRTLNTEVVGSLPLVKSWRGKLAFAEGAEGGALAQAGLPSRSPLPTSDRTLSGYEEAVRTLRNSILLGSFDRPLKSLMLTSASPSEGKTTTAVHLALAHAQQNQRTLLIDGDLRRPSIHRKLGVHNEIGLADALSNGMDWRAKITTLEGLPELHILSSGPASRRAADQVGRGLPQILAEAANDYDLVIVDAPPFLGFPEPLQMAAAVDGVVIVARAGETNRKAVTAALSTLSRLRANVLGLVLNEVTRETSSDNYYYSYYGKSYKYYGSEDRN